MKMGKGRKPGAVFSLWNPLSLGRAEWSSPPSPLGEGAAPIPSPFPVEGKGAQNTVTASGAMGAFAIAALGGLSLRWATLLRLATLLRWAGPSLRWATSLRLAVLLRSAVLLGWAGHRCAGLHRCAWRGGIFSSGEATSDGGKGRAARSSAADRPGRIVPMQRIGEDCLSTEWPFSPARDPDDGAARRGLPDG